MIHYAFSTLGAAEERGRGMKRFKEIMDRGFPRPRYSYEDPYLTLTIPLTLDAEVEAELLVLDPDTTKHLTPGERRGLAYLVSHPRATNEEYGEAAGVTASATIERQLRGFVTHALVKREGPPRNRTITVLPKALR